MDLGTFAVILVFASKVLAFKPIQHFRDGFGRLSEHRFQRNPGLQLAIIFQIEDAMLEHCRDDHVVVWKLTVDINLRPTQKAKTTYL